MAAVDIATYKDSLLVLATAAVVVPIVHRFRVSPILGFLAAGMLLGPHLLGALVPALPPLRYVTIDSPDAVGAVAEIGIVFLLFLIGLELSFERLTLMKRLVFGMGALQLVISGLCLVALGLLAGLPGPAAIVLGAALSLSSTAIVIEMLARQKRLSSATGRASFSILLFQDLAFVPIILLVGILATGNAASPLLSIAAALAQGAFALLALIWVGRLVLRPLFRLVASTDSPDLFIAAAVLVALGTGVATAAAGMSMALGAFVAGLLLAETEYRRAIETIIEPFKSLLLGVFFFSVGMKIDPGLLLQRPGALLGVVAGVLLVKALTIAPLVRGFGFTPGTAIKCGLLLAPGGEFAFVIITQAMAGGVVDAATGTLVLTATALTMALTPGLDGLGRRIDKRLQPARVLPEEANVPPPDDHVPRAIVVGGGRVGRLVADMLTRHGVRHLMVDRDPQLVARLRREGRDAFYGDASQLPFLQRCHLDEATALIITIDTQAGIDAIVTVARQERPDLVIIARARDAAHATQLYRLGVTDAVPETIEASLQLSEAALVGLGVPTGLVIASIHEQRDVFRAALQGAGEAPRRAIRDRKPRQPQASG